MGVIVYSDTILVPLSLFATVGYHAYLWHNFKKKPSSTSIGVDALKRKSWFRALKQGNDKMGMLAVQSMRNTLMVAILTATIAILVNIALAALTNNAYRAEHLLSSPIFGSHSTKIYSLKFGSASLFLLVSFLCSSLALCFLIDANYLINTPSDSLKMSDNGQELPSYGYSTLGASAYTQAMFERGFMLALFGNRLLCITFPLLLWMFGPVPVALSSGGLVWLLYELDFAKGLPK